MGSISGDSAAAARRCKTIRTCAVLPDCDIKNPDPEPTLRTGILKGEDKYYLFFGRILFIKGGGSLTIDSLTRIKKIIHVKFIF